MEAIIKNRSANRSREMIRIGIATDFSWSELKMKLTAALNAVGYELPDIGAYELVTGDDYPDFVVPLAKTVFENERAQYHTIRGSVDEACAAANKIPGVYAALIKNSFPNYHVDDDLYVMSLGGQIKGYALSRDIEMNFLNPNFKNDQFSNQYLAKVNVLR